MTLAVNSQVDIENGTGSTTIAAPAITTAVGDLIEVMVVHDSTVVTYTTTDDRSNTYTQRRTAAGSVRMASFTAPVTTGGSTVVQVAFSASVTLRGIIVKRITGTSIQYETGAGQFQGAPGTGTDAVTTGNGAALSTQPALYSGISIDATGSTTPSSGTSFTAGTACWDFGGGAAGQPEHRTVASTSADDATWTAAADNEHGSLMHVYTEAGGGGATRAYLYHQPKHFVFVEQ